MEWRMEKIGEWCDVMTGGTPRRSMPSYWGGKIKWMASGDINKVRVFDVEGRITELGLKNSNTKLLPPKTVMIALNGQGKTRGMVAITEIELTCNQSLAGLVPKSKDTIYPDYLFWNLYSRYKEIRHIRGGEFRSGLNLGLIREIMLPLPFKDGKPDLAEQKRIVDKLNEAIAKIEQASDNVDKTIALVQKILSGELEKLFVAKITPNWKKIRFGDYSTFKGGKQPPKSTFRYEPTDGYVQLLQIRDFGKRAEPTYVSEKNNLTKVSADDILIARYGASVGRILTGMNGVINVAIIKTEPKEGLDKRFLYYFLQNPNFQNHIRTIPGRMAQAGFDKSALIDIEIPTPSKNGRPDIYEQKMVANRLDALRTLISELENHLMRQLENFHRLKSSLLAESFQTQI